VVLMERKVHLEIETRPQQRVTLLVPCTQRERCREKKERILQETKFSARIALVSMFLLQQFSPVFTMAFGNGILTLHNSSFSYLHWEI
jgi:hypothetical protein